MLSFMAFVGSDPFSLTKKKFDDQIIIPACQMRGKLQPGSRKVKKLILAFAGMTTTL